jgi:hypothetical protein
LKEEEKEREEGGNPFSLFLEGERKRRGRRWIC